MLELGKLPADKMLLVAAVLLWREATLDKPSTEQHPMYTQAADLTPAGATSASQAFPELNSVRCAAATAALAPPHPPFGGYRNSEI